MRPLEHKKLLTLITSGDLQRLVVETLRGCGVGGYTVVPATGAGSNGLQMGFFDCDSNVVIYVIMSEERLQRTLEEIDRLMRGGYRIKALVSDIAILPRKPQAKA
ncbi:P-II family nitrogen regulator [Tepidimonas sp. HKU79]|uniref:P-II family nitrogen regulator n=1 Tax=unclassified Tepidimonas TaxID=2631705 RepID=UPI003C7CA07D